MQRIKTRTFDVRDYDGHLHSLVVNEQDYPRLLPHLGSIKAIRRRKSDPTSAAFYVNLASYPQRPDFQPLAYIVTSQSGHVYQKNRKGQNYSNFTRENITVQ